MNIIQHHGHIDFDALFKHAGAATIGLDSHDMELFATGVPEIHSFLGSAGSDDRVRAALEVATGSYDATDIISKCRSFLLIIRHDTGCSRPLMVNEMSAVNDFVTTLPTDSEIQWRVMPDASTGNKVEVLLLCKPTI